MPTFKLPLSGDVFQAISPWTAFMSPIGSQVGLFNVRIGQSSEPAVEGDVLSDVASYGKQLGRIGDALIVLLAHFRPAAPLTAEETAAIDDLNLKDMLRQIADVKEKHKRKAMRPGAHVILPVSSAPEPAETPLPSIPVPAEPTPRPAVRSSAPASSRRAARKTTPRA
jgi:hypothetical protein